MIKYGRDFHGDRVLLVGRDSGICGDDGHNERGYDTCNLALVINVIIVIL
jgi:hypothetical protein